MPNLAPSESEGPPQPDSRSISKSASWHFRLQRTVSSRCDGNLSAPFSYASFAFHDITNMIVAKFAIEQPWLVPLVTVLDFFTEIVLLEKSALSTLRDYKLTTFPLAALLIRKMARIFDDKNLDDKNCPLFTPNLAKING